MRIHLYRGELLRIFEHLVDGGWEQEGRHLLACGRCQTQAVGLLSGASGDLDDTLDESPLPPPAPEEQRLARRAIGAIEDRLSAVVTDRKNAKRLFLDLLVTPTEERIFLIEGGSDFLSPGLAHRLLDRAEEFCEEDPREADHLAALALVIGKRLPPPWSMLEQESLLGRCRCVEADSQRVRGDLVAAGVALRKAFRHLEVLPVGSAERTDFCRYLARLRLAQERDDEALALMGRAVERFEAMPDRKRAALCRVELGWMLLDQIETEQAVHHFERAVALGIDERDFRHWLSSRHGLALGYADRERGAAARAMLVEVAAVAEKRPRADQLRARVVEAAVAERLDCQGEADDHLRLAWVGLMQEGAIFEALHAALDLARLHVEMGWGGIEPLKEQLLAVPGLTEPLREALGLGLDFVALHGHAAGGMLEAVQLYLHRARHHPEARLSILLGKEAPVAWEEAEAAQRAWLAFTARLAPETSHLKGAELTAHDRHRLVWAAEMFLGIRLVFAPGEPAEPPSPALPGTEGEALEEVH